MPRAGARPPARAPGRRGSSSGSARPADSSRMARRAGSAWRARCCRRPTCWSSTRAWRRWTRRRDCGCSRWSGGARGTLVLIAHGVRVDGQGVEVDGDTDDRVGLVDGAELAVLGGEEAARVGEASGVLAIEDEAAGGELGQGAVGVDLVEDEGAGDARRPAPRWAGRGFAGDREHPRWPGRAFSGLRAGRQRRRATAASTPAEGLDPRLLSSARCDGDKTSSLGGAKG